jgi:hypothetical protein
MFYLFPSLSLFFLFHFYVLDFFLIYFFL